MLIDQITRKRLTQPGVHEQIARSLEANGWCITEDFITPQLTSELGRELLNLWHSGRFRHAGIGRGAKFQINPDERSDWVRWLDPAQSTAAQRNYLSAIEELRLAINGSLFLGLFEFAGHLALYPPRSHYRKHLDQFDGTGHRILTCVLYLNQDWIESDGGQLRVYNDSDNDKQFEEILPLGGRLVTFFSSRFPHSVMPARRNRLSITGWFTKRMDNNQIM